MSVVDAHVHVWDTTLIDYPWLRGHGVLGRPHLPAQIDDGGGVVREWVFVEADPAADAGPAEARWADALEWPGLVAIVARVDLTDAELEARLDEVTRVPRVRGIRHILESQPVDEPWSGSLAEGLASVAARGLAFDACVRWTQLPMLHELLARVPRATVVLDHLGKPPVSAGLDSESGRAWHDGMRRLAELPTLAVKLSGLAAEANEPEVLQQKGPAFLSAAIDLFGAGRCMFGSDWPVSGAEAGGVSTGAWSRMVRAAIGEEDVPAVFGGTARRVYGLPPEGE